MRHFIKKTAFFILYVLALISALQLVISIRISGKTVNGYDNLEQTAHVDADLVFLGSSRCFEHFDPKFFDTTYHIKSVNIGVEGHSEISMAIVRLKTYLLRNKAPRIAVFSFDPIMKAGSFTNNDNFVNKNTYARYAFFPSKNNRLLVDYFRFNPLEKYVPMYAIFRYNLFSDAMLLNHRSNYVTYGYERHDEKWDGKTEGFEFVKDFYFKPSEENALIESLDSLKRLCEANKIKLLCVQTPITTFCYVEHSFSETKKICRSLNIPFIDADQAYIRNDTSFFANSYHLNTVGVGKLNEYLKGDSLFNAYLAPASN
jgi:hypothetical protein